MDVLDGNGFIPDYQAFDTSPNSKLEKGMHWIAAESSGRTPELATKVYTSLTEMRRILQEN